MDPLNWTKLPSLTALRAFEAAASTESFSAAARSLNVTHAAVAQQVSALEEFLGTTLVQRSPRGLTLTPKGKTLAADLRTGFVTIADSVQAILTSEETRPVRVTTTSFFAEAVIFPHIAAFWLENPGIEISFVPSDKAFDLVADGYDLAVRAGEGNWPDLNPVKLIESPTVACAAPALVDAPDTDWSKLAWLIPNDSFWERDALAQSGFDTETIETIDVGNPSLEIKAAEEGLGLVLESTIDLKPRLDAGTLKIAPVPIRHSSAYYLVTPPWPPRPAVRKFAAWLQDICGQQ